LKKFDGESVVQGTAEAVAQRVGVEEEGSGDGRSGRRRRTSEGERRATQIRLEESWAAAQGASLLLGVCRKGSRGERKDG
jgi:hypothetical protein